MTSATSSIDCDVLIVGGGNAGFCAAVSASQTGAQDVLLIDTCPEEWAGGNSYFTAGAMRTAHSGLRDILPLVNNVDAETAKLIDLVPYTQGDFLADMERITHGKYDRELGRTLAEESTSAIQWLASNGVRFQLPFNRQAYKVNGRYKFWGGLYLKTEDGGRGLVQDHQKAAVKHGVKVLHQTGAEKINLDPETGAFKSLLVDMQGKKLTINATSVVLAAGGFESNPRMRATYLGPGWDLAHKSGNREISNEYTKSGYPFGVTINIQGNRFFDEGSDIRNYTYAKFGRAILAQPQGVAFQVWDSQTVGWLRDEEYRDEIVEKIHGISIEELAQKCANKGLENPTAFVQTLNSYNEAVYNHRAENNSELKPRTLHGDQGGLWCYFTFGGLAVDPQTSGVTSSLTGKVVPGVFCAGEMLGGLFYENYPGGSGLTSGAVFGRQAGIQAAAMARKSIRPSHDGVASRL
ncbi:related to succinate dehydrogenase/fumarate reductase, flavoprotein subunit [Rhynchosporium agropyri]|uniref:Related to succinate dehydrogenase/fumarate reductase, flavoprotein subunit n=1 Tax=Rhynchosporium agropyri TaxID=914238 RepID=A0A1E1LBC5_9HELO|nr:related to succinate dehydrogenase/fumarate reductase, flavoprotein subunit [Rhynchosporium agropyri]